MKKKVMIISTVLGVGILSYIGITLPKQTPATPTAPQAYADARLSALELSKGVEAKINLLLTEISQSQNVPTPKSLSQLRQAIVAVRAYGHDISVQSKEELKEIVQYLKVHGFENQALLEQLDLLARSSKSMAV